MNPDIKGIISDMDGVILDTEKLYVRFWCEAALFTAILWKRTTHSVFAQWLAVCNCKIKGLFRREF